MTAERPRNDPLLMIKIRKAKINDVKQMFKLLNHFSFSEKKELLPRSMAEIFENLQTYVVAEEKGHIVGTCALYVVWENLAEVKALCVAPAYQGKGFGKKLFQAVIEQARDLEITQLFALTQRAGFFEKFGFVYATKDQLPNKVWTECVRCPYFPDSCVEIAMVKDLKHKHPHLSKKGSSKVPPPLLVPSEPQAPGLSKGKPRVYGSMLPSEPPYQK